MKYLLVYLLIAFCSIIYGQDTIYAREVIKKLCSKELLGRGYVNNGVNKAANFLSKELKTIGVSKFGESYSQYYSFSVNTFPKPVSVMINNQKLIAGKHFLISATCPKYEQSFTLIKKDSTTYQAYDQKNELPLQIKLRKKLTYTVGTTLSKNILIELLKDSFPNALTSGEIRIENKYISNFKCENLCGFIKGTQYPDSFIVFTAHYDHLGTIGQETYFAGANDNASGVSALLNLAKYYKSHPHKYSVAFIFFSGEEAGLLGSKYYSEHPIFPLSQIKFLTNLDLLGTGDDGITVVNASVFKPQFELLNQINITKHYLKQIKIRGKAANSDHYWFTEKGVPSFFIYTMGGIQAYHDIYDVEQTLPLTRYLEVCNLLIDFTTDL